MLDWSQITLFTRRHLASLAPALATSFLLARPTRTAAQDSERLIWAVNSKAVLKATGQEVACGLGERGGGA